MEILRDYNLNISIFIYFFLFNISIFSYYSRLSSQALTFMSIST